MDLIPLEQRPTALYRFYDREASPVYFGMAVDPPGRWGQHEWREWWPLVDHDRTIVDWYADRPAAHAAEVAAIQAERPSHNLAHADYHPPLGVPVTDLRGRLADVLNDAVQGQITYVTSRGRRIAAVVPIRVADDAVEAQQPEA